MIKEIKKDIEGAKKLIKFNPFYNLNFSKYGSIYAFTNENLSGYLNRLNIDGKEALTVAGSGDQTIELLIRNINKVDIFDINNLTKYYIDLKIAAIKALEYNDFVNFFFLDHNVYDVFNERTYNKIRRFLDERSIIFWDALFSSFNGKKIRLSKLFFDSEETYYFLSQTLSYLEPKKYYELKHRLIEKETQQFNIHDNFKNIDMTDLANSYTNKYDLILLSNISDYIEEIYKQKPLENFKSYILNDLSQRLNDTGIICVAYMFWAQTQKKYFPIINNKKIRQQYFKENFEEWLINNNHITNYTNDHVLVYKKTR